MFFLINVFRINPLFEIYIVNDLFIKPNYNLLVLLENKNFPLKLFKIVQKNYK